jgi:hypothetical protein
MFVEIHDSSSGVGQVGGAMTGTPSKQIDRIRRLREMLLRRAAIQRELRALDQKIASVSAAAMNRYLFKP